MDNPEILVSFRLSDRLFPKQGLRCGVQAYGSDVSQWTRQQLIEAAGVVTGLSAAEVGVLNLRDLESINAVGNNGQWTSTQVRELNRFFYTTRRGMPLSLRMRCRTYVLRGAGSGGVKEPYTDFLTGRVSRSCLIITDRVSRPG